MSKRKVSVEDKIICCKSISGWKKSQQWIRNYESMESDSLIEVLS